MITIDALKALGADTEEGMHRCMNNEAFYLRMVGMGLKDPGFGKLDAAVRAGDLKEGFEAAHALKGILGNLSLTPLFIPVSEITELLRRQEAVDYGPLLDQIREKYEAFRSLAD